MLKIRNKIELFRKVVRQIVGINEFIETRTAIFVFPFCSTVIHNRVQQKIDTNQGKDNHKKVLFQRISLSLFILLSIFWAFPSESRAKDTEKLRTSTTLTQNIILCRTGRLTDIVVPEKV